MKTLPAPNVNHSTKTILFKDFLNEQLYISFSLAMSGDKEHLESHGELIKIKTLKQAKICALKNMKTDDLFLKRFYESIIKGRVIFNKRKYKIIE